MAMSAGDIEQMIREAFPDASIEIDDLRGDGDHYAAKIVSGAFAGLTEGTDFNVDGVNFRITYTGGVLGQDVELIVNPANVEWDAVHTDVTGDTSWNPDLQTATLMGDDFWNVEIALLAMRKPEPVKYVSEINQRYLSYLMLGVE